MLIIKFTDSYGHQEEIRFAEFETLSDYLAYHLKHHGFGEDERPSRWEELSYEELTDMVGDKAADSSPDAYAIAKRYGKAVWGCGPGIPTGWYAPQDLHEVLHCLWDYISQSWRDVEVVESKTRSAA
jgi:uncharacterized protein YbdZ (MbtH family)